jgi:hypothetical protein
MGLRWERDDERRLLRATLTEPYSIDDVFALLDAQAAEGTWEYATFCDVSSVKEAQWFDPARIRERILEAGRGRPHGPICLYIGLRREIFKDVLQHPGHAVGLGTVDVLLTPEQAEVWIERNAPARP